VAYTPDSTCIIAGGNSKYICIYEISQQILLKKFQLTYNRSIDGILDEVRLCFFVKGYIVLASDSICKISIYLHIYIYTFAMMMNLTHKTFAVKC
jgi:hypothetical protein